MTVIWSYIKIFVCPLFLSLPLLSFLDDWRAYVLTCLRNEWEDCGWQPHEDIREWPGIKLQPRRHRHCEQPRCRSVEYKFPSNKHNTISTVKQLISVRKLPHFWLRCECREDNVISRLSLSVVQSRMWFHNHTCYAKFKCTVLIIPGDPRGTRLKIGFSTHNDLLDHSMWRTFCAGFAQQWFWGDSTQRDG